MSVRDRLQRLRGRLRGEGVDALIVSRAVNVAYLTGSTAVLDHEDPHVVVVTASSATLYTDTRYAEVAERDTAGSEWAVQLAAWPAIPAIAGALADRGVAKVAVEDTVQQRAYAQWQAALSGVEIVPADAWVERIRMVKDAAEIERIAAAQAVADEAFTVILQYIEPGRTERQVALELEMTLRRLGADALAFPSIVASGPNGSLPHAVPGDRVLARGDLVTLDFGALLDGYHSDMTRTVAIGEVAPELRTIYETVLAANRAGVAAVAAGVSGVDADRAARAVIEDAGFGHQFGHGTGHGVGLEIHEGPNLSPRAEGTLEPGMVVTVEPGIYVPGVGGVRIEDLLVVTEGGARVLSVSPRELISL